MYARQSTVDVRQLASSTRPLWLASSPNRSGTDQRILGLGPAGPIRFRSSMCSGLSRDAPASSTREIKPLDGVAEIPMVSHSPGPVSDSTRRLTTAPAEL